MPDQKKNSSPSTPSPVEASRFPGASNAFSQAFLVKLRRVARLAEKEPRGVGMDREAQEEALWSGPFGVERLERDDGVRFGVVRDDEPVCAGGKAAVYRHRDEALRLAAVLPAVAAPPVYHLGDEPKPHGCYALHRGRRFVGHLAPGVGCLSPERRRALTSHLDLARYLATHPGSLALVLESVGPEALPVLGRALARRIEELLP